MTPGMLRIGVLLAGLSLSIGTGTAPLRASSLVGGEDPAGCSAPLTLLLRPGPVPGAPSGLGPPARDIPPGPAVVHLPLYPGAVTSSSPIPLTAFEVFPSAYRKVATADFAVPAGFSQVLSWYRRSLAGCGFVVVETVPLQQRGGLPYLGFGFNSRNGLRRVDLIVRPLSPHRSLVGYVVQALDLPPRPVASYLHGPFVRVSVLYRSQGDVPAMTHTYRFTITWPATIARLVATVNGLRQIAVSGLGSGGTIVESERVTLSFVRPDGGARTVTVGSVLDRVVVGRTRPLDDTNGVLMDLVHRIVNRRCAGRTACS